MWCNSNKKLMIFNNLYYLWKNNTWIYFTKITMYTCIYCLRHILLDGHMTFQTFKQKQNDISKNFLTGFWLDIILSCTVFFDIYIHLFADWEYSQGFHQCLRWFRSTCLHPVMTLWSSCAVHLPWSSCLYSQPGQTGLPAEPNASSIRTVLKAQGPDTNYSKDTKLHTFVFNKHGITIWSYIAKIFLWILNA